MFKKPLTGLAPALAMAALVTAPAQAAPHYYRNGAPVTPVGTPVIEWGTTTLAYQKGGVPGAFITCHDALAGTITNPAGAGGGVGATEAFSTYRCEAEKVCPSGATPALIAEGLPWPSVLTEEKVGTIRQETTGIRLLLECLAGSKIEAAQRFLINKAEKGARPPLKNGSSALHPSFMEFDAASGELEAQPEGSGITVKTEGEYKLLGFEEQEQISVKSP